MRVTDSDGRCLNPAIGKHPTYFSDADLADSDRVLGELL